MAWRLLGFQKHNIFENMAIDEAILHETTHNNNKQPTIRFYASTPAAVTIGYFQDAEKELNTEKCKAEKIDIARRITGGRAVFHFKEMTYSITAAQHEQIFPSDILGTYKIISRCLARGLHHLGINACLAEEGRSLKNAETNTCCFSTSLKNELLVNSRKICGSAQVRKRGGFLQHGLMFLDFNPEKTAGILLQNVTPEQTMQLSRSMTAVNKELAAPVNEREICSALKQSFTEELGINLEEGELTPAEEKLKNNLMKKYTDTNWNIKREKYF